VPGIPRHKGRSFRKLCHCPEQTSSYLDRVRISEQVGNLVQLADHGFPSQTSTELVIPITENPRGILDLLDRLVPHRTRPTGGQLLPTAR
jgi:hypothetical protein